MVAIKVARPVVDLRVGGQRGDGRQRRGDVDVLAVVGAGVRGDAVPQHVEHLALAGHLGLYPIATFQYS